MTLMDKACYERGCACYDSWDGDGVKVVAVQQSNEQSKCNHTKTITRADSDGNPIETTCGECGERVAQQSNEQVEPVAWLLYKSGCKESFWMDKGDAYDLELTEEHQWKALYTHPPVPTAQPKDAEQQFINAWNEGKVRRVSDGAKPWVGLTMADKEEYLALDFGGNRLDAMDWAEKRLKEKNQ